MTHRRANPFLLSTFVTLYGVVTLSGPALHALPGFGHGSAALSSEQGAAPGRANARTPPFTTARSATSTLRGSSLPIPAPRPARTSCEFARWTNRSSPLLWPLTGLPVLAHLPAPDLRQYNAMQTCRQDAAGSARFPIPRVLPARLTSPSLRRPACRSLRATESQT